MYQLLLVLVVQQKLVVVGQSAYCFAFGVYWGELYWKGNTFKSLVLICFKLYYGQEYAE
jgi:hypothetical protein